MYCFVLWHNSIRFDNKSLLKDMGTVKLPFYARLALTLLAIVLVLFLLSVGKDIFMPLLFALLIAILLFPLCKFFEEKLHLGSVASPLISLLLFVGALGGFVNFIVLQFIGFADDFPALRVRFTEMLDSLQHWLSHKLHITNKQQSDYINRYTNSMLEGVGQSMRTVFLSVTGVLLMLIFIFIFTFFILYHRRLLMKFVLHLFSEANRPNVNEVIVETKTMINSYVVGLVIEMALIGVVNCTILLIMGVKFALLLGVVAAVLNIIPYLGIYTATVLSMVVTFANSSANTALGVGAALMIVHFVDSNILFPRIVGGRVKMNPFITIIAVIVGEYLWGIPGMFLFIPIVGIIKLVCERVKGLEAWGYLIGVEDRPKPVRGKKMTVSGE
jgi:AI-2 transport protein TqsA